MNKENNLQGSPESRQEAEKKDLPEDVLNKEQDPNSLKDPLIDQLEKSKDQNSAFENNKLEELKKNEKE